MRGGVGDASLTTKSDEAAFRGNYSKLSASNHFQYMGWMRPTENLIANVVLPDKVTEKLFIHTRLIDNLCIQLATSSIDYISKVSNSQQYPRMYTQAQ
jgi:hypothetical protein